MKNNSVCKKTIIFFLGILFCINVNSRSLDDVLESGFIEIAVYNNFPPYSFIDKNNKPAGIDIEIGKLIANHLNLKLKWFWFSPDENLEDDLRNVIWKGAKIQKKIADLMLRVPYDAKFSHAIDSYGLPKNDLVVIFAPYQLEQWGITRNIIKTEDIRNLAIFNYEKIGVEIDTLVDFHLLGVFRGLIRKNVVHFNNIAQAITELKNEKISAVAGLKSQLEWFLIQNSMLLTNSKIKDTEKFDLTKDGLEQISKQKWDIGMAVRHDFRQLSYKIEEIIDMAVKDKTIEKIFNKFDITYTKPLFYQEIENNIEK